MLILVVQLFLVGGLCLFFHRISVAASKMPPPPRLPEELLMEILSWLPAKSLLRFRSVCRSWCSHIQNPHFIAMHHNRAKTIPNNGSLLIMRHIKVCADAFSLLSDETLNLLPDVHLFELRGLVEIFGSCNGIVCLAHIDTIVLWNPSIREFKLLPPPPFSHPLGLSSLTTGVGFGFDPNSRDYKVVKIAQFYQEDVEFGFAFEPVRVEIYNLSSNSWRLRDVTVPFLLNHFPSFDMFYNGAFHLYRTDEEDTEAILAFDIGKEVFRQIQFPAGCSYSDGRYRSLSVLNGLLALILYEPEQVEKRYDIWVMTEYGVKESWTRVFSIGPLLGISWPLGFWKDDELFFESSSGQLLSYKIGSQEIREFEVHGISRSLRVLPYTESLVSIKTCNFLGGVNDANL